MWLSVRSDANRLCLHCVSFSAPRSKEIVFFIFCPVRVFHVRLRHPQYKKRPVTFLPPLPRIEYCTEDSLKQNTEEVEEEEENDSSTSGENRTSWAWGGMRKEEEDDKREMRFGFRLFLLLLLLLLRPLLGQAFCISLTPVNHSRE